MRILLALLLLLISSQAFADEPKPDDAIALNLSAEDWVTTATARVVISVNISVSGERAANARAEMLAAVKQTEPKSDWKLTSFNRSQDSSGLEQWQAQFEARMPEADLAGLNDRAKTASKPGMQLLVAEIDFTPTLGEMENARASLRKNILAQAARELAAVNAELPGRGYRIANVRFDNAQAQPVPMVAFASRSKAMDATATSLNMAHQAAAPMQTAQRITLSADIVLQAVAPTAASPASPAPAPATSK